MPSDIPHTIAGLRAAYAEGLSPVEVVRAAFARLDAVDDPGLFLAVDREAALAAAEALGPPDDRPLWGVPFAVKDNIDVEGLPTTAGCPAYAYDPAEESVVVARLRAAGAICLGKTNLDQFATGLVGTRTPHPVPKNALDPALVPGGSSSGSAVAVAHRIAAFSLGTDTAGSGRVPAALNGLVGLKPTLGALSNRGVVPACRTLDTISIFAHTTQDAWDVFRVAAAHDPADAYSRDIPVPPLGAPPGTLRIGVPSPATRRFFGDGAQEASFAATLAKLAAQGADVVEMDFTPFYAVADLLYEGAWVAERMTVIEALLRSDPEAIHPVTRAIVGAADKLSAADAFRGLYRLADLKRITGPAIDGVDLLAVPTIPSVCSVTDVAADPIGPNSRLGTYTNFVNLLDLCGIAVPTETMSDGRPGSVTFLARAGRDGLAAAVAARLAGAEPAAPAPMAGEVALAVVGAHLSGMPLNHEVTSRGGRFLEATRTSADYKLYALPGGPPERPGLVRSRAGSAIDLELWALPEAGFGAFVAGVPSPLCIGTLELEDGRKVKGFLAEALAIEGARDISDFGGWRAYTAARHAG